MRDRGRLHGESMADGPRTVLALARWPRTLQNVTVLINVDHVAAQEERKEIMKVPLGLGAWALVLRRSRCCLLEQTLPVAAPLEIRPSEAALILTKRQ